MKDRSHMHQVISEQFPTPWTVDSSQYTSTVYADDSTRVVNVKGPFAKELAGIIALAVNCLMGCELVPDFEQDHVRPPSKGYRRVLPRDLFNEAGLLKALGRLSLLIHDGFAPKGLHLQHSDPTDPFTFLQDVSDGSLFCDNVILLNKGHEFLPRRSLNSRDPWDLFILNSEDEVITVFDDAGDFTPEFIEWASSL